VGGAHVGSRGGCRLPSALRGAHITDINHNTAGSSLGTNSPQHLRPPSPTQPTQLPTPLPLNAFNTHAPQIHTSRPTWTSVAPTATTSYWMRRTKLWTRTGWRGRTASGCPHHRGAPGAAAAGRGGRRGCGGSGGGGRGAHSERLWVGCVV